MSKPKNMKSIYWSLFAAGGMIAALVLPTLIAILSLLLPMELLGNPATFYDTVSPLSHNAFFYILIVGVLFLMLWHTAHRFYYVLHDFHIHVGIKTRYVLYALVILCSLVTLLAGL